MIASSKRKRVIVLLRFGHSLWSARASCQRKRLTLKLPKKEIKAHSTRNSSQYNKEHKLLLIYFIKNHSNI